MRRQPIRRKCRCCKSLFVPDPRTKSRQRFCSKLDCRKAGKSFSQRRWLTKHGNGDYFRGPENVRRVQAWRKAHPNYWKHSTPSQNSHQPVDIQLTNPVHSSCNAPSQELIALQDECLAQRAAFAGLISMVTGSTLQEDIAATTRRLLLHGRNILGCVSPSNSLP